MSDKFYEKISFHLQRLMYLFISVFLCVVMNEECDAGMLPAQCLNMFTASRGGTDSRCRISYINVFSSRWGA